jgi:hypothetical protein
MKKINFCIILYDKKISESKSISSLLGYFEDNEVLGDIIVFNNGPRLVEEDYSKYITCHQVLINASLSKIYNKFINEYPADYYVFLDDDTVLNERYLDELQENEEDILFPRILCQGIEEYPIIKKNKIQSVTSGLALSSKICALLKKEEKSVFDERFDLYGIDTAFCNKVNQKKLNYYVSENTIEHDLSHISSGSNDFRDIEVLLANSASIFPYFSFRLLVSVVYGQLKMIKKLRFNVLLSSLFSMILQRTVRTWRF